MSESKEYVSQTVENGSIHISEEVVASIAAMAIRDVDGVYGLHTGSAKKNTKGIRLVISEDDEISIDCYLVVLYGYSVIEVAKSVQEAVTTVVESTTGRKVCNVNVNISGINVARDVKK